MEDDLKNNEEDLNKNGKGPQKKVIVTAQLNLNSSWE
jgi:hypothetical protein